MWQMWKSLLLWEKFSPPRLFSIKEPSKIIVACSPHIFSVLTRWGNILHVLITPISCCTLHPGPPLFLRSVIRLWSLIPAHLHSHSALHSALPWCSALIMSSSGLHAGIQLSFSTESWWSNCPHCHPPPCALSSDWPAVTNTRLSLARVTNGGCTQ